MIRVFPVWDGDMRGAQIATDPNRDIAELC